MEGCLLGSVYVAYVSGGNIDGLLSSKLLFLRFHIDDLMRHNYYAAYLNERDKSHTEACVSSLKGALYISFISSRVQLVRGL